jgi:hypothetical protein
MEPFAAASFSDIAKTPLGKQVWSFLNNHDIVIRLETATYLRRPALEAVQRELLAKFGDEIRPDRWKQMMGRMTRQIMESKGYALDRSGVRIRDGELFTSAARYKGQ